jgi:hypothetical protein
MRNWTLTIVAIIGILAISTAAQAATKLYAGGSGDWDDNIWSTSSSGPFTSAWNDDGDHIAVWERSDTDGKVELDGNWNVYGIEINQPGASQGTYGFTDNNTINLGAGGLDFNMVNDQGSNQKFQNVDFFLTADQSWSIDQKWRNQGASLDVNGKELSLNLAEWDGDYSGNNFDINDTAGTPGKIKITGGSF